MYQEIDCRGLSCPQPVINAKKALESINEGTVLAIVDNEAAKENLLKFARGMNFSAKVEQIQENFKVAIHKGQFLGEPQLDVSLQNKDEPSTFSILITSQVLGKGSDELGNVLVKSFFYSLTEQDNLPRTIAFLNSGVKLTCEGSAVLEHIIDLSKRGCEILSCGTCLDFYSIKHKLCVGSVSNMYTILETLQNSGKIITL